MAKIESGVVSDIANAAKKMFNTASNVFKKFIDLGMEIKEDKTKSTDTKKEFTAKMTLVNENDELDTKEYECMIFVEPDAVDSSKVKVTVADNNNEEYKVVNNLADPIKDAIKDLVHTLNAGYVVDFIESANGSAKLSVTLQKVQSADGISVNLLAIKASSDPVASTHMLNDLLDNEEFTDIILDTPTSFEITDTEDDYDIAQVDEIDPCENVYYPLVYSACCAWYMLKKLGWNYRVEDDLYTYIRELANYLMDDIDMMNSLSMDQYGCCTDILDTLCEEVDDESYLEDMTHDAVKQLVMDIMSDYIAVLEYYSVNMYGQPGYENVQDVIDDYKYNLGLVSEA